MKTLLLSIILATPLLALAYASPGTPAGLVNDFAHVLTADQVQALEETLETNRQSTGSEIAVVTIPSLEGDTVENYAVKLFEEWGIGQKDKDNGALLLIAIEDRQMRIEVGYGLEPVLTDALTSSIIRNTLTPAFKEGKYYEGVSAAVGQMTAVVAGDASAVPLDTKASSPWWADAHADAFLIFLLFGAIQWLMSMMARSRSWWLGGVVGGVFGVGALLLAGLTVGLITSAILVPLGLALDYFVSREYGASAGAGRKPRWWAGGPWIGGGLGGGGGSGFGGFGGGSSGGGGASGSW
jgi:uncharacterized protein